jgi:K+ potassium transporter
MFYGSSLITPALSVLAAVEGLKVATPAFEPFVLPVTVVILIALFAVQSRGTGKVALLFGPRRRSGSWRLRSWERLRSLTIRACSPQSIRPTRPPF